MNPSVKLIQPWTDPPNTIRASNINEMYDIFFNVYDLNFVYNIGGSVDKKFVDLYVRNNTISHELKISIKLPKYLTSKNDLTFIIRRNTIESLLIEVNEQYIESYIRNTKNEIESQIEWTITPLKVESPVYVRKDLPALSESVI